MNHISQINWMLLVPELIILVTAACLSLLDLFLNRQIPRKYFGVFSFIVLIWASIYIGWQFDVSERILADTYVLTQFSSMIKLLILIGTAFVILLSLGGKRQRLAGYEGEYYYLLLIAALGGMVMSSSADLITLFVGLELLSISSYVLVGLQKHRLASVEAAWKYVVLGSVSSAFILYGMSFLYGLTGSTNLYEIEQQISFVVQSGYGLYIYLALFLMVAGFGFKIATAPFHTWAPDVYEGAYTPVTSFLAVVSKIATFGLTLRIFIAYMPLVQMDEWQSMIQPLLFALAVLSMVIGNTAALRQTHAKRLMAYSGVAQIGYLLIPLATLGEYFLESIFYYLIAYLFMTMGAFAILYWVTEDAKNEEISAFAGLYQRSPIMAILLSVFLISLAGFPLTAGFFGKFYILLNTLGQYEQFAWMAIIMIVTTVISYFYYFRFLRQVYFRNPVTSDSLSIPIPIGLAVLLSLVGTIGLAILPGWVAYFFHHLTWLS